MPPAQNQTHTSTSDGDRQKKRSTLNAAESSLSQLEAYFRTNLKNGLAPKDAAKRLAERDDDSLFQNQHPGISACIKPVLREPVMWLFLAVSLVALFFNRVGIGLLCLIMMVGYSVLCVILKYKALRIVTDMQAEEVPLSRVIRNRRLFRIRGDRLVPGDILLLRRGDLIPADGRLITTRRFCVMESTLNGDKRKRETLLLEKDANATDQAASYRHSPPHMVYAGGVVHRGYAKALVVAVSSKTHLGGLISKMPSPHPAASPAFLEDLRKILSKINLILAVSVIPLTALGILAKGNRYGFLDIFLSALLPAILSLTEHTLLLAGHHYTAAMLTSTEDPDRDSAVDIRVPETLETLEKMDHLILMGSAALHDGVPHPRYVATCGRAYPLDHPPVDEAAILFSEKMYLLSVGQADRLKKGLYGYLPTLEELSRRLCEWTSVDTEALLLRLNRAEAKGDAVEVLCNQCPPMTLYLVEDPRFAGECDASRSEEGLIPMKTAFPDFWQGFVEQAYEKGFRLQFLISESEVGRILEGAVILSVEGSRKTAGCIKDLEARGVRVLSFLRDHLREDVKILKDTSLRQNTAFVDLARHPDADFSELLDSDVRNFVNCTTEQVLDYMEAVRQKGGCVGVFSVESADRPILEAADIAFACLPIPLKDTLADDIPRVSGAAASLPDGQPDSDTSDDLSRRHAHVLLRRCGAHGGGVCGIRRALLASGQMALGLTMSFRFVLLSSILRILMLALPLMTGVACLQAPILLLSGFVMDALAVMCYTRCDLPEKNPSGSREGCMNPKVYVMRRKAEMILTAASCVVPYTISLVTRLTEGSARGDMAYFCALSLLWTQLTVYFAGYIPKRHYRGFWIGILMVCVCVATLAVALGSGLHILWCLLLPLAQSAVWLVGYMILRAVDTRRNHHVKK